MWVQGRGFAAKPRGAWNEPRRPRRVRPLPPRGSTAAPTAGQGRGETGGGGNRGVGFTHPAPWGRGRDRGFGAGQPREGHTLPDHRGPLDRRAARLTSRRGGRLLAPLSGVLPALSASCRAAPRPLQAARCACQQPDHDPRGYGCRRAGAGGVAGRAGAGNHPERLRGARGPAGPVHEAHRRGAAQPGRRPPPGGASPRASPGQVPAAPVRPERPLSGRPGRLPALRAPAAVLLGEAAFGEAMCALGWGAAPATTALTPDLTSAYRFSLPPQPTPGARTLSNLEKEKLNLRA